jgi:hypothetical protein
MKQEPGADPKAALLRRRKAERDQAIATYAAKHAGTDVDLDVDLEAAAVEHLAAGESLDHRGAKTQSSTTRSHSEPL